MAVLGRDVQVGHSMGPRMKSKKQQPGPALKKNAEHRQILLLNNVKLLVTHCSIFLGLQKSFSIGWTLSSMNLCLRNKAFKRSVVNIHSVQ